MPLFQRRVEAKIFFFLSQLAAVSAIVRLLNLHVQIKRIAMAMFASILYG